MFNIMKFTGAVLKSLFIKGSACKMYPIRKPSYFEATRGAINIDIKKCIFCSLCAKRCPTKAITVTRDVKTWEIERLKCILCGACVDCCPTKCLSFNKFYPQPSTEKTKDTFKFTEE